ncbi:endonuclease/exonuclease/phosphatase family protein [Nocardia cyriacigeorgica]|uniref:endonuclease/exonuclease/phosphatase family protein n=1 Tax=Nocardia cyriacigeorgica TaxID=135487 RepID=UPI0018953810|nr:endonuclease/exonuclease/phosphatase family protein [Nocardia cyriacigeorgica]MBF6100463.1 endonuclease/exonuclease/phosphatase family protein [Nocardia cyriacigeorgica]MBF6320297.1 endonuclease/exonuclease/phosphatase family protein [Nocardia cyriacigeorgica]MBF6346327.1 endonuclease/exonuclease/phosphatase family protein [Nocardia cyriacigeorgica]MBF6534217.1 endonuclease/exonuclease/phosphatase family protein [Nocardia cyriacigeorgica]
MTIVINPKPDTGPGVSGGSVRVATFNILSPLLADWPRRKKAVAEHLRATAPDIIALQEVDAGEYREQGIVDLLGPGWHLAWHSQTTPDGVGLVLASRWPFGEIHEHSLGVTDRAAAFAWSAVVVAEVRAPQPLGTLHVAHHKPLFQFDYEHERELQAVEAARFIEEVVGDRDEHVVVVGDFDASPDSSSIRFWTGRQSLTGVSVSYHDAWDMLRPNDPGHTFTPDNPLVARGDMFSAAGRRIDYVMVRGKSFGPTLELRSVDLIGVQPQAGIQASDHYGVVAELSVPSRAPGVWS